jgi:hypothetical protein
MVVLFAHGRPAEGIGHYLQLGEDEHLTPTDLIEARTPPLLALISCWGARAPRARPGDPLTLATLALVRGSACVLATTSELADDPVASAFVNDALYSMRERPAGEALRDATRRLLSRQAGRDVSLWAWAPLVALGTW